MQRKDTFTAHTVLEELHKGIYEETMKSMELYCAKCERYIAQIRIINGTYTHTDKCYLCEESEHLIKKQ